MGRKSKRVRKLPPDEQINRNQFTCKSDTTLTSASAAKLKETGDEESKQKMQDLQDVHISPLPDSPYVKPFRLNFKQNGMSKNWDLLEVHDSVAIIIYNISRNVLIMVKQFRPAVYYNSVSKSDRQNVTIDSKKYPASLGITLEFCAGIIDKNKSWDEIAREEVLEECGYDVPVESLELVMKYRSGVGTTGSLQALYYCEVKDEQKTDQGGGVDDELIDVIEMSIEDARSILMSKGPHSCPPSFLFGLSWFMMNKANKLETLHTLAHKL